MHMTRSWNIILSHSEKNVLTLQEHDDLVFCELCVAPGTGTNNRVLVSCWVSLFKGPELLGIRFLLHHTCEPCQTTSRVRVCVHVRKSEPASGSTPVLSTNCGSKLNNQTVTLCHIGACYLVGFSWQTWYVRHVREKLRHNQSKPNTKYVLWRFDMLQRHSVWSTRVMGDQRTNHREALKQQWTEQTSWGNSQGSKSWSPVPQQDSDFMGWQCYSYTWNYSLTQFTEQFHKKLSLSTVWLRQASERWDNSVSDLLTKGRDRHLFITLSYQTHTFFFNLITLMGALCSFIEEMLMRRERLADLFLPKKVKYTNSLFSWLINWINKLTLKDNTISCCFILFIWRTLPTFYLQIVFCDLIFLWEQLAYSLMEKNTYFWVCSINLSIKQYIKIGHLEVRLTIRGAYHQSTC